MAIQFLNLHNHGFGLVAIFWGLWLFPLGLLVYRAGFVPRILGVLLMVNCLAYPVTSFTSLLLPQYEDIVSRWNDAAAVWGTVVHALAFDQRRKTKAIRGSCLLCGGWLGALPCQPPLRR